MAINLAYRLVERTVPGASAGTQGTIERCGALVMQTVSGPSHPP